MRQVGSVLVAINAGMFMLYMPPLLRLIQDGNPTELASYLFDLFPDGGYPEWAPYHPEDPTIFHMISHQLAHAACSLGQQLGRAHIRGRPAEYRCRSCLPAVYLLGGAAGAVAHGMWDTAPLPGSSGAVAAIRGCHLAFRPGKWESARIVIFWLTLSNVIPLFTVVDEISYAAHIGGFVAGVILGAIYDVATRRRAARA